ncbi:hypothetical protein [Fodinicola feengrottensis]|uniref:hypothetical protein n=1 Tax=Fodinicola feengrottensis TaxID=435914 RepID=UPI0013D3537F|nr:hypothetical protein [Fodinicola feengrottensis]
MSTGRVVSEVMSASVMPSHGLGSGADAGTCALVAGALVAGAAVTPLVGPQPAIASATAPASSAWSRRRWPVDRGGQSA